MSLQWREWLSRDGTLTEVAFDRSDPKKRQLLVRETISHHKLNAILDANAEMFNGNTIKESARKTNLLRYARIPEDLYWRWRREYGNPRNDPEADKKWKQLLNSNEFRAFRTIEGIL